MKIKLYSVLLLLVFVGGCATGKPMTWLEKGTDLSSYKGYEVMPVSNDTGRKYDFDVAGEITEAIKNKLKDKGYVVAEDGAGGEAVLVLKCSLTAYEPGSAFKRWLAPGYGATQCTVKCPLIDKKTGKSIGEIMVAKAISAGGLYTIGAHKSILGTVADDIAEQIDAKAKGGKD